MNRLYVREGSIFRETSQSAILDRARELLAHRFHSGAPVLREPENVRDFLQLQLACPDHEVFATLFLDARLRLIEYVELFRGTVDGASVHPREVVKEALTRNAAAVILVHNHPSGDPSPSETDREITTRLQDALSLIDIRVVDHLVVGETVTSFAEQGFL